MAFLEIIGVTKSFEGKRVLSDIHLNVEKGSFVSLLGLSGCGKTTLLRIIAGLESADSGKILLDGKDITDLPSQERSIGIVFQNYALFPHLNVFDNVAFGLKIKKIDGAGIKVRVAGILEKVQLSSKAEQNVSLLSGGEQQRVALARAIVTEPRIILLDEPLSNLDHSLRLQARNELKRLQHEIGITSVYVTHDQTEALVLSEQIAVMDKGIIVQTGSPKEIYHQPTNVFTAEFVGHYNSFSPAEADAFFNLKITEKQRAAILPEHLGIKRVEGQSKIKIRDILFAGTFTEYVLSAEGHLLRSVIPSTTAADLRIDDTISISASPENIRTISV